MDYTILRDYAWMSQASYLGLEDVTSGINDLKVELQSDTYDSTKLFTLDQANTFTGSVNGYSFIYHQENTPTYPGRASFKPSARI